MDSGLERPTTINTRTTFQSKNRAIKKEKRISRIKPKKTLKVPSRRLESRIEKRKVARLIGGPVVRQSACPLWCHLLVRVELLFWLFSRPQLGDASVPNVHHPAVLRVPMRMLSAPLTKIVVERRPATERRLNRES